MMNETDAAAFGHVPTLVKPRSTHGLRPTGVMSIAQTSCKATSRHRVPFPSSANYNPYPYSSPSSRVVKANKPKRHGGSASSSSSLARAAVKKRRRTAADVAVVTSTLAATTTAPTAAAAADELGIFRHHASQAGWEHPVLPGSPSYGGDLTAPDTSSGGRDHFTLSSTLSQTPGPDLCYWPCSPAPFSLDTPTFSPTFHTPSLFPAAFESREDSLAAYPTDYPGITTQTFNHAFDYPLHLTPDFVNAPAMTLIVGGDVSSCRQRLPQESLLPYSVKQESADNVKVEDEEEWCDVPRPYVEAANESGNPFSSDGAQYGADLSTAHINDPVPWVPVDYQGECDIKPEVKRSASPSDKQARACLDMEARRMTGKTRKLKACIRCRMQKIRCVPDPEDDEQDCLTCRAINLDSKKVIHRLQCLRWKLAEVVLFREGGLNLTRRWTGVKVKDLGPRDWVTDRLRIIRVTIGYREKPLELLVRKFKPNQTDVTWKNWVDKTGNRRSFNIEPYALANVKKTAEAYQSYVYQYAWAALVEYSNNHKVHPVVRSTYKAAMLYVMRLDNNHPEMGNEDVSPENFLRQYFYLWFAIRNTLGSAFVVGEDTLDMRPVDDPECPYHRTISVPRMIPAQFDSIGHEYILAPKRKQILEGLWKMMASKNPHHFFAVYLIVFMLLHEASVTSADRLRRARENNEAPRYDLVSFVEKLQEGANIILSHWHYYKRNVNAYIMGVESKEMEEQKNVVWGELDPDEVQLLVKTRQAYAARETGRLGPMTWEDDLYFVSQMFDEGWQPRPTFR
ncbi:hypothetical protein GGR52DRAFT_178161 [Hypoxylon sp. FL1284]|nr:hypothetical protein GGR52DRAFT_178161 [Hypoxylon sp. FL1284]